MPSVQGRGVEFRDSLSTGNIALLMNCSWETRCLAGRGGGCKRRHLSRAGMFEARLALVSCTIRESFKNGLSRTTLTELGCASPDKAVRVRCTRFRAEHVAPVTCGPEVLYLCSHPLRNTRRHSLGGLEMFVGRKTMLERREEDH